MRKPAAMAALAATVLVVATPPFACPVPDPDREAVIVVPLDGDDLRLHVIFYEMNGGMGAEGLCSANVSVKASDLLAVSRMPQPIDLAEHLVPLMADWEATQCSIHVYLQNDTSADLALEDLCWYGDYRYEAIGWSTVRSDRRCFEAS